MTPRHRKIFPELSFTEEMIGKDDNLYRGISILLTIKSTVRFKNKKVWYEVDCCQTHSVTDEMNVHKSKIIVELIQSFIKDVYGYQQLGLPTTGATPCRLQISEKTRLDLKEAIKYNNLNNMI